MAVKAAKAKVERAEPMEKADLLQMLVVLAPPIVWFLHQQTSYMVTPSACEARAEWWLHLVTAVALLLVAGSTFLAWVEHKRLPKEPTDEGDTVATRSRFLTASGVASGVFFAIVIIATELPNWFLGACLR